MSNEISAAKIDELVVILDRPQLLANLDIEDCMIQVGDSEVVRPISASSVDPIVIYKNDVYRFWEKFTRIAVQEQSFDVSVTRQWAFHVSHTWRRKAVNFVQFAARFGQSMTSKVFTSWIWKPCQKRHNFTLQRSQECCGDCQL